MKYATARRYALSLDGVSEAPHHHFGSFRVQGRIFITVPPQAECLHVFVPDAVREQALALYPDFTEKLSWGGKVVGLRVALAAARVGAVKALIREAWQHKSPRRREKGEGARP
jgi:hypothetical protein